MLFCTKSSPLFAFNDWYDANVYFTMGKGLMNGYVPYIDLIDNKGPLLYLLYGIAWLFDNNGFLGVYILQSLFVALSVIYTYRLSLLFVNRKHVAFIIAISSPLPMLLNRFYALNYDFGGGGPDEFCRSLMIVSLFYFTLYYLIPEKYKSYHTLIQGCLFMCVCLLKFNLIVFWIGFLFSIAVELILKKQFRYLLKHIALFIFGSILVILPYIIYGTITKSLRAFVDTYFLYNWLYVNPTNHPILKILESFFSVIETIGRLWGFTLLFSIGLVFVFLSFKSYFKIGYSLSLLFLFIISYYATTRFATLHIPLTVSLILGMIAIGVVSEKYIRKCKYSTVFISVTTLFVMLLTIKMNGLVTYDFFLTDKQTTQQQIADIVLEQTKNDYPTLLEINSLDSGFYTAAGIIPDEPYFFVYNIDHKFYPYPRDAQEKAVSEGRFEFVIASTLNDDTFFNPYNIRNLYDEITVMQGSGYQSNKYYHLFQLKSSTSSE